MRAQRRRSGASVTETDGDAYSTPILLDPPPLLVPSLLGPGGYPLRLRLVAAAAMVSERKGCSTDQIARARGNEDMDGACELEPQAAVRGAQEQAHAPRLGARAAAGQLQPASPGCWGMALGISHWHWLLAHGADRPGSLVESYVRSRRSKQWRSAIPRAATAPPVLHLSHPVDTDNCVPLFRAGASTARLILFPEGLRARAII